MDKLWPIYAAATVILWGMWGFFAKLSERSLSPWAVYVFAAVGVFVIPAIALLIPAARPTWEMRGGVLAFLAGLVGGLGALTFYLALHRGQSAIVVPLTALYPLVTVLLGLLFLHEKLLPIHWAGVALAIMAGFLLSR